MTNLRLRKPRANKRLTRIGLVAVLVLALGFGAVRFLGLGQPMLLVATKTIVAGDRLTAGNTKLAPADVRGAEVAYLDQFGPTETFATATIAAGELVPKRLLAESSLASLVSVAIEMSGSLSSTVAEGREVDLWSAGGNNFDSLTAPRMIASQATVRTLSSTTALSKTTTTVELAMNPEYLDAVLAAQASKQYLTLVALP
jgi:predicted outer membrane protein